MIENNINLKKYNTFRVASKAMSLFSYQYIRELDSFFESIEYEPEKFMALGEGSNTLFVGDYPGVIVKSTNESVDVEYEDSDFLLVRAGAGLNWDEFVSYCVKRGFKGLERLSLIPGSVGAAPVQNIGAYGAEVSQYIEEVECYDAVNKIRVVLANKRCRFGYRDSIFKKQSGLFVVSVVFKLYKKERVHYECSTGRKLGLKERVCCFMRLASFMCKSVRFGKSTVWRVKMNFSNVRGLLELPIVPSVLKRAAVVFIRKRSMPDPDKVANVGCFFKSPLIDENCDKLRLLDKSIGTYECGEGLVKVSAGDMIRFCGLHKLKSNGVCFDENRPLIIINYNGASGKQIYDFSEYVVSVVEARTGIKIEPEVVIV